MLSLQGCGLPLPSVGGSEALDVVETAVVVDQLAGAGSEDVGIIGIG